MSRIAILIDAENVLPQHAEQIFTYAESLGTIVRKEIFGAGTAMNTWVEPVLRYALHPNLTIKASKGKNTSDIALVIGAMDLLAERQVDTVIIASSDSDFSMLSVRLRSAGLEVIGMGTERANPLWRTACSSFVALSLRQSSRAAAPSHGAGRAAHPAAQTPAPAAPQQPASGASTAEATEIRDSQNRDSQNHDSQNRDSQNRRSARKEKNAPAPQPQEPAREASPVQEAAPAPAAEAPAPAQEPSHSNSSAKAKTHSARTSIIRAHILEQLAQNHGEIASSVLFTSLNTLPEYRVDQQRSRRKPLNYLQRQFSDVVRVEEREDGTFILPAAPVPAPQSAPAAVNGPEAPTPETAEAPARPKPANAAQPEPAAAAPAAAKAPQEKPEAQPEKARVSWKDAVDARAAEMHAQETAPAAETPAEAPAAENPEQARELGLLMEAGISEEVSRQLLTILSESSGLRQAYNRIRKVFGNKDGSEYYARVKEIAAREAAQQLREARDAQ